mmetsp:Transcript_7788/g.19064  ORF Transcript_7788/g.19064 Transcript_7788/m.19064 type:complete len:174 (+) Transcript_7788:156-677(+)|eukprot:CAMPEP_0116079860 /NCGR_PEP_ID=MMETSP0327-20121206/1364_1 /TAXON_ID=44447 /ORGANISM="Pseudo-nitzschia delicatissima, Strain B596" /LENGTH=173 /DNA_ID=CAMNT_0003570507 /DNA_START=134 /DNA_END=655 /DNA_ORIENTATION=+
MARIDQTKDSRDEVIRSRLLHSLGIHRTNQSSIGRDKPHTAISSVPTLRQSDVKLLGEESPIQRKLNDSKEHQGYKRWMPSSEDRKGHVRFNSIVTEKQIASHKKYSDRIKRQLWGSPEEIQENAYRNQIEYQAEGMNWKSVLENDEMYVDAKTGELIHPFWVESDEAKQLLD